MIVISDTSPIINLAIIDKLDLLPQLFDTEQFGLNFTGLLGILIKAKEHGLIPSVKPLMDALRTKARFFIHQSLYNQVLAIAKEEP